MPGALYSLLAGRSTEMGIHASDNLSHLAHQAEEPNVPDYYDYDEFVIAEVRASDGVTVMILSFGLGRDNWDLARTEFLRLFVEEKRAVKLLGRVFN
jgi:hypothetical protein